MQSTEALPTASEQELLAELPKQEVKEHLTALAESAIQAVLGGVPRPLRRAAARMYATEAWRVLTNQPRYREHLNGAVIAWVVAEYREFLKRVSAPAAADTWPDLPDSPEENSNAPVDAQARPTPDVGSPTTGS
jgi:hypothetical protein